MVRKAIVACSIFIVLFIGAWWANEIHEKRYIIDEQNDQVQILTVDEENRFEKFRPREYIKIKR